MTNIKNAKYRIKNEEGQYEVVHFETSMKQVIGLDGKVAEIEGSIADRYTKEETNGFFQSVGAEIDAVEAIAEGLNTRLTTVEGEVVGKGTSKYNPNRDNKRNSEPIDIDYEEVNKHADSGKSC